MPQVWITKSADGRHSLAPERDLLLPLDPLDPDVTRAKQLQRRRGHP